MDTGINWPLRMFAFNCLVIYLYSRFRVGWSVFAKLLCLVRFSTIFWNSYIILFCQINVKNWVCILPVKPLKLSGNGADPLLMLRDSFIAQQLVDVLVVCSPEFSVVSSGHKRVEVIREIPIKTLEYSIASMFVISVCNAKLQILYFIDVNLN